MFFSSTGHATKDTSDYQTLMKELCCTDLGNTALHGITEFFQEDYDRFPFPARDWKIDNVCDAVACSEQ